MTEVSEFDKAYTAGIESLKQISIETDNGAIPVLVAPGRNGFVDCKVFDELIFQNRTNPVRIRGTKVMQSVGSFLDYFNRFKNENSSVFIDADSNQVVGVIDYHESNHVAHWEDHKVAYTFPRTEEWASWISNDNEKMSQEDFALFIEENAREIVEPEPADMLQIALTLKANTNVDFKSSLRLENGQTQFVYNETINGTAGNSGQLEIPEKIKLQMRPFKNGAAYEIEARFRYRINQGKLTMWYTLIRPNLSVDDAINDIVEAVKTGVGENPVYLAEV